MRNVIVKVISEKENINEEQSIKVSDESSIEDIKGILRENIELIENKFQ